MIDNHGSNQLSKSDVASITTHYVNNCENIIFFFFKCFFFPSNYLWVITSTVLLTKNGEKDYK